jgi:hypothetical protein
MDIDIVYATLHLNQKHTVIAWQIQWHYVSCSYCHTGMMWDEGT